MGGQIDGFFRRPRAGQPLRALANVDNLNKVANILNDISGEGCTIDKPLDGKPWIVRYDGQTSDNVPLLMPHTAESVVDAVNQAVYNPSSGYVRLVHPTMTVNGLAVAPFASLESWWPPTNGVKDLNIYQHYYTYTIDADGQYSGNPDYIYTTQTLDGNDPNFTLIARIPYCRVEAGDPPKITCLLEGPLRLYCFRGDADTKAYAPTPIEPTKQIQTSKTIDNSGNGELPLKVRNIDAEADGFFDEYPNGRWRIEHDELIENPPDAAAKAKNDAKAVLLRYKAENVNGLPYWASIKQFQHNAAEWVEDFVFNSLKFEVPNWLIDILIPIAWEIWNEDKGPFCPVCPDRIGNKEVIAAFMGKDGQWHSIYDIVVEDGELDDPTADYEALAERADYIGRHIAEAVEAVNHIGELADELEGWIDAREDYGQEVAAHTAEAAQEAADAAAMASEFSALDARITALEQRVTA